MKQNSWTALSESLIGTFVLYPSQVFSDFVMFHSVGVF